MRSHRFFLLSVVALWLGLPSPATAACQAWQLPSKFNAVEDSGFFVVFDLRKTGPGKYRGPAHYNSGSDFREVKGEASARLDGPRLDISAAWKTSASGGYYTHYKGSIDTGGTISGLRVDTRFPVGDKSREVFWKSRQKATCLDKLTPPAQRPRPSRPVNQGFVGVWQTQTSAGLRYTLTLTRNGKRVTGRFVSQDNSLLDGTLEGTLNDADNKFTFTFAQPKSSLTGQGSFYLSAQNGIDGRYTLNSGPGNVTLWTGTRKN